MTEPLTKLPFQIFDDYRHTFEISIPNPKTGYNCRSQIITVPPNHIRIQLNWKPTRPKAKKALRFWINSVVDFIYENGSVPS